MKPRGLQRIRRADLYGVSIGLVALLAIGCTDRETAADNRSVTITYEGQTYHALRSGPRDAPLGIVMVHDWFGVSAFMQESTARLGGQGYDVVAVDLYRGASADNHAEAGKLMGGLDPDDVQRQIAGAIKAVGQAGRPVVVLGFSMGGGYAYTYGLAAGDDVDAVIVVYGGFEVQVEVLANWPGDLLLITGSADAWAMGSLADVQATMAALERSPEIYIYPDARHAFAQILYNGGLNYDAEATAMAWLNIDAFLERQAE